LVIESALVLGKLWGAGRRGKLVAAVLAEEAGNVASIAFSMELSVLDDMV